MSEITLSSGQQKGYEAFVRFITDPTEQVMVLEGYSGTGKTTLVETLIDRLPKLLQSLRVISDEKAKPMELVLSATTNKAAEAFAQITGQHVPTVHNVLGLRVHKDYRTGKTTLVPRRGAEILTDSILVIDEASYIDKTLLQLVFERTERCKVMFIGDPAQLLTVGCTRSPVFDAGFTTAKLTEVMRQAKGNPIIDLATAFRGTVNTGEFFSFTPDGTHIKYLPREDFDAAIVNEFDDPTWSHNRSKVLAWTNKMVIKYNHAIRNCVKGAPNFHVGDYAVCNKYIGTKECNLKTDQLVHITDISELSIELDVEGRYYTLDNSERAFMPECRDEARKRLLIAKRQDHFSDVRTIEETWLDLRAAYACTINKAQGSTYDQVFIDLDDIKKCNSGNQIARMLYVAVSRARHTVYLCGDLV